ncbi:MAG: hypothetical protein OFPII_06840 [Osedax symbiont Rs1]|nr:MAG: hypothetical protein OFPII_06840 [Osedax symbiont Rs1]
MFSSVQRSASVPSVVKKSLKDWFYHRGHREEIKSIFCYGGVTGLIRNFYKLQQHIVN